MNYLHSLHDGYQLREFRIESNIGGGGFGLVYAATDTALGRAVVIKEYLPNDLSVRGTDRATAHAKSEQDTATYQWGLTRFMEEARLLASIKHPNIVPIYQVFSANNTAYLVMEDEGRRSLRDILEAIGTLDQTQVMALLEPLLSALETVHTRGILHRDLKPENILIREDDSPVLIDFGSARQQVGSRTHPLTALVSEGYAPLEQYDRAGIQGPYTDLYALGAVLYECLTGSAPPAATRRVLKDDVVSLERTLAGRYAMELRCAIDQALKLRPEERPATIGAFRAMLCPATPARAPSEPAAPSVGRLLGDTTVPDTVDGRECVNSDRLVPPAESPVADQAVPKRRRPVVVAGGLMLTVLIAGVLMASWQGAWWAVLESTGSQETPSGHVLTLPTPRPVLEPAGDPVARSNVAVVLEPELVRLEGGCFQMGSPVGEAGRNEDERQHRVCVESFDIGKYEVTVGEFRRFVEATGYQTDAERNAGGEQGCWSFDASDTAHQWAYRAGANWRNYNQYQANQDAHPVACVSWNDAQAYIAWLNRESGGGYRLPSEAEWEYAARAGTTSARFWGDEDPADACHYASIADTTELPNHQPWAERYECADGDAFASPVGRFKPNPWGLYDMLGNVSEWTCSPFSGYGAQIGVSVQDVTLELAQSFGFTEPRGALVAQVDPDSPAAAADLRAGDIILEFNGEEVSSSGSLPSLVGMVGAGHLTPLRVLRNGQKTVLNVKPTESLYELRCDANADVTSGRALRGGSWGSDPRLVRAASHLMLMPTNRDGTLGFRLAQDIFKIFQ